MSKSIDITLTITADQQADDVSAEEIGLLNAYFPEILKEMIQLIESDEE